MLTALTIFGLAVAVAFAGWRIWRRTRYFLHLLQLDGYKRNEYQAWIRRHRRGLIVRLSHLLAAGVLLVAALAFASGFPRLAAGFALVAWPVVFASSRRYRRESTKKPLVYTDRMRRLIIASALLSSIVVFLPLFAAWLLGAQPSGAANILLFLTGLGAADFLAPSLVLAAGSLAAPLERRYQLGYKAAAREKLKARPDLLIVAITGSYGKTSTKGAVAAVLGHRLSVLASPGSYNTPMGLCRVINDMLKPHHQVLVLEMGARYPGDIQELCDIALPHVGIVTNVGVAHLESMGSVEAIAREKGTLIERIPSGGTAILNADDPAVAAMRARARTTNIVCVGTSPGSDIRADNIRFGVDGTSFDAIEADGERHHFHTEALGLHNVMNVLFALAVGRAWGMRLREMAHAVKAMPAVAHRLRLRKEGEVFILDDAFNSNPVGARNAVDILGQFSTGHRFVVTPGMVELGERQADENRAFGSHMAGKVDTVLLVGAKQTLPIREGLRESGFPDDAVHTFSSLREAQEYLRTVQRPGDIVLYENDLPDHYEEAA
jgi:UDP-N-acetylmuramoyl-tripeptide--D-alanyl-D-alanine ligase